MHDLLGLSPAMWESIQYLGPKMLAAILCGGLIGLERELKNKAAGIKTNMLICVGSMLFTATSLMIARHGVEAHPGDPARVAAQIVSGIGFLGGGAIMQSKEQILGLTTAASIWLVAAVGVWIGIGEIEMAIAITIVMLFVMVSVTFFENRFLGKKRLFRITIHLREKSDEVTRNALEALLMSQDLSLSDYRETMSAQPEIRLSYHGRLADHSRLLLELWKLPGILDIRQN